MAAIIPIFLWVVGCYALAAACVHMAFHWSRKRPKSKKEHYVLVAGNEQQRMEWYMRALRRYSHRSGKEVQVTVVDRDSQDETLPIAELFHRKGMQVNFASGAALTGEEDQRAGKPEGEPLEEGSLTKWQRFRRLFVVRSERGKREDKAETEPTHLVWKLQAEGIVTEPERVVLVDLREPSDWSKLPL